jgi:hypothetical protein
LQYRIEIADLRPLLLMFQQFLSALDISFLIKVFFSVERLLQQSIQSIIQQQVSMHDQIPTEIISSLDLALLHPREEIAQTAHRIRHILEHFLKFE